MALRTALLAASALAITALALPSISFAMHPASGGPSGTITIADDEGMDGGGAKKKERDDKDAKSKREKRKARKEAAKKAKNELPRNYRAPGLPGIQDKQVVTKYKTAEVERASMLINLDKKKTDAFVKLAVDAELETIDLRAAARERGLAIIEAAKKEIADLCDVKAEEVADAYVELTINAARQPAQNWVRLDPATMQPRESSFIYLCGELELEHDEARPAVERVQKMIQQDDPYTVYLKVKSVQDEALEQIKRDFTPEEYIAFMLVAGTAKPVGDEVVIAKGYLDTLKEIGLQGRQPQEILAIYEQGKGEYSSMREKIEKVLNENQRTKLEKKLERLGILNRPEKDADVAK